MSSSKLPTIYEIFEEIRSTAQTHKIDAIVLYRQIFGGGLREAKESVESIMTIKQPIKADMELVGAYSGTHFKLGKVTCCPLIELVQTDGTTYCIVPVEIHNYLPPVATIRHSWDFSGGDSWVVSVNGEEVAQFSNQVEAESFVVWRNKPI